MPLTLAARRATHGAQHGLGTIPPMPRFYRYGRLLNRLFFALVIVAGLFGWFYGARNWQPDPSALELDSLTGGADWIELIAGLLEDAIQIFQEITA